MRVSMQKSRQNEKTSVAAVQLAITEETDEQRLVRVKRLLDAVGKVDLVLLPELWRVGYFDFASYSKKAETLAGETVSFLRETAAELGAYLLGGSIVERRGEKLYNTAVLLDPEGKQIGSYRKGICSASARRSGICSLPERRSRWFRRRLRILFLVAYDFCEISGKHYSHGSMSSSSNPEKRPEKRTMPWRSTTKTRGRPVTT
jgi:hypothetical protein